MEWPDLLVTTKIRALTFRGGKWADYYEHEAEQHFYGITWNKHEVFIATPKFIVRPNQVEGVNHRIYEGMGHDIHQIHCHKEKIYVANTSRNTIDVWNCTTGKIEDDLLNCAAHDKNHINSVFFDEQDHMWICAHNNREASYLEEYKKEGDKWVNVRRIEKVGNKAHNVYIEDGFAYTQSSASGCVVKINLKDETKETFNFAGYGDIERAYSFGRGLARTKDYFIFALNRWAPIRDNREASHAYIVLADSNLKFLDHIKLPLEAQVKDIRVISEPDLAHNGVLPPEGTV